MVNANIFSKIPILVPEQLLEAWYESIGFNMHGPKRRNTYDPEILFNKIWHWHKN